MKLDFLPLTSPEFYQPLTRECILTEGSFCGNGAATSIVAERATRLICPNSNGYLTWWLTGEGLPGEGDFSQEYLVRLQHLASSLNFSATIDDRPHFYVSTIYSGWNFGHELSILLHSYTAFLKFQRIFPNAMIAVNLENLSRSKNGIELFSLLFPSTRTTRIKHGVSYGFSQLACPPSSFFHLANHNQIKKPIQLINWYARKSQVLKASVKHIIKQAHGKFCLVKRESHTATRKEGIMPKKIEKYLQANGFFVLCPDELSFLQIVTVLRTSKTVIMGTGAVQYAHKTWIPRETKVVLCFKSMHNYPGIRNGTEVQLDIPEKLCRDEKSWDPLKEWVKNQID